MKTILWGLMVLLTLIPLVMYLVYSLRRLNTRRQLLLQTLLTLGLDDAYMRIRHGEIYNRKPHFNRNGNRVRNANALPASASSNQQQFFATRTQHHDYGDNAPKPAAPGMP